MVQTPELNTIQIPVTLWSIHKNPPFNGKKSSYSHCAIMLGTPKSELENVTKREIGGCLSLLTIKNASLFLFFYGLSGDHFDGFFYIFIKFEYLIERP